MNYLELCQRAKQECAISGTLSTISGTSGELGRLVSWVALAYDEICALHADWNFMRSAFTVNTVSGTQAFEITDCTDTRIVAIEVGFAHWWPYTFRIYRASAGIVQQTFLPYEEYEYFRDRWILGQPQNQHPMCFSIRPDDDAILLGPTPDAIYTITGEYQIEAPVLNEDDDEPLFPARFHPTIAWLAMQYYAEYMQDAGMIQLARQRYTRLMDAFQNAQRRPISITGPLA